MQANQKTGTMYVQKFYNALKDYYRYVLNQVAFAGRWLYQVPSKIYKGLESLYAKIASYIDAFKSRISSAWTTILSKQETPSDFATPLSDANSAILAAVNSVKVSPNNSLSHDNLQNPRLSASAVHAAACSGHNIKGSFDINEIHPSSDIIDREEDDVTNPKVPDSRIFVCKTEEFVELDRNQKPSVIQNATSFDLEECDSYSLDNETEQKTNPNYSTVLQQELIKGDPAKLPLFFFTMRSFQRFPGCSLLASNYYASQPFNQSTLEDGASIRNKNSSLKNT